jgi:hypothetical protein
VPDESSGTLLERPASGFAAAGQTQAKQTQSKQRQGGGFGDDSDVVDPGRR